VIRTLAVAALLVAAPAAAAPPTVELRAPEAVDVGVGATAVVSLTVAPPSGRSISSDGPVVVELSGDGVALPRRRYGLRDAADPAAEAPRFDLRVRGETAGEHPVTIAVRLWLCGKHTCRPVRAERRVTVRVAAPVQGSPTAPGG
jgi:hypothetical protein